MFKDIVYLLRIRQWVKNAFIFVPAFFGGVIFAPGAFISTFMMFANFCLLASGVYILNDLHDLKSDSAHPLKHRRGAIIRSIGTRRLYWLGAILSLSGLLASFELSWRLGCLAAIYVLLNILYNRSVKHMVILDVIFIAIGFEIRVWCGAISAGVLPSQWLLICVFILALFLGFAKRRNEMLFLGANAKDFRVVFAGYTRRFLDQMTVVCSTLTITFYGLYTMSDRAVAHPELQYWYLYSIGFIIFGMARYLYVIQTKNTGGDPGEVLASDRPLLITIVLWIAYMGLILYFY